MWASSSPNIAGKRCGITPGYFESYEYIIKIATFTIIKAKVSFAFQHINIFELGLRLIKLIKI